MNIKIISLTIITIITLSIGTFLPVHTAQAASAVEKINTLQCGNDPFSVFQSLQATGGQPITNVDTALDKLLCLGMSIVSFLSEMAILVATLYIVLAGIKYQTASGDPKKQQSAVEAIKAAVIGFILALSITAIINYALSFIAFDTLTGQFKKVNLQTTSPEPSPTQSNQGAPNQSAGSLKGISEEEIRKKYPSDQYNISNINCSEDGASCTAQYTAK